MVSTCVLKFVKYEIIPACVLYTVCMAAYTNTKHKALSVSEKLGITKKADAQPHAT
jgi:hypothetical protein